MVHYYCSSLSQAVVCAQTLNYVHIQLDWLTVQVATDFIVHEDMATEVTSGISLVRLPCQNYSHYKASMNGYGGSVGVLSWLRSVGSSTESENGKCLPGHGQSLVPYASYLLHDLSMKYNEV